MQQKNQSFFFKPAAFITHNATQPPTVRTFESDVMLAAANVASGRDEERASEVW